MICFGLEIKLERNQILGRTLFDFGLLFGRKFCLELRDNRLRKLALNCEQIRRGPIVGLRPDMRIGPSIDQLRIDAKPVSRRVGRNLQRYRQRRVVYRSRACCVATPLLYWRTLVWLITFSSETLARLVRIWSCTPSAK